MNIHQKMRARSTKSGSLGFLSQTPRENLKNEKNVSVGRAEERREVDRIPEDAGTQRDRMADY